MHRVLELDLGESCNRRRKEMLVFVDTEEGSFCDCCKRMVLVRMVTMCGCGGEYGGPEVCETCIAQKLSELVSDRQDDNIQRLKHEQPTTASPTQEDAIVDGVAAGVAAINIS